MNWSSSKLWMLPYQMMMTSYNGWTASRSLLFTSVKFWFGNPKILSPYDIMLDRSHIWYWTEKNRVNSLEILEKPGTSPWPELNIWRHKRDFRMQQRYSYTQKQLQNRNIWAFEINHSKLFFSENYCDVIMWNRKISVSYFICRLTKMYVLSAKNGLVNRNLIILERVTFEKFGQGKMLWVKKLLVQTHWLSVYHAGHTCLQDRLHIYKLKCWTCKPLEIIRFHL